MSGENKLLRGLVYRMLPNAKCATFIGFAVLMGPLLAGASLAIEYGRALKVRSELQQAADAAAESALDLAGSSEVVIANVIRGALDANLRRGLRGVPFTFTATKSGASVKIEARLGTRLSALVGKDSFNFKVTSTAVPGKSRTAWSASALFPLVGVANAAARDEEAEMLLERAKAVPLELMSPADPKR